MCVFHPTWCYWVSSISALACDINLREFLVMILSLGFCPVFSVFYYIQITGMLVPLQLFHYSSMFCSIFHSLFLYFNLENCYWWYIEFNWFYSQLYWDYWWVYWWHSTFLLPDCSFLVFLSVFSYFLPDEIPYIFIMFLY